MRAWQINSGDGVAALELADVVAPEPGPGEVLIDVQASSINYRDLTTIEDPITRKLAFPTASDFDFLWLRDRHCLDLFEGLHRSLMCL